MKGKGITDERAAVRQRYSELAMEASASNNRNRKISLPTFTWDEKDEPVHVRKRLKKGKYA